MFDRIVSAPARPVRWSLVTTVAALVLGIVSVASVHVRAQAPAPTAPQPKPKTPPKPTPKKPPTPPPQVQEQPVPQPPPQTQGPVQMPQLIYSPWAKFCGKGQQADAKQVCFTGKDARTEAGVPVVAAALIEPDGEPNKLFRVTLPSPLQLKFGTRLIIDQQEPIGAPFVTCFSNGCLAEFPGTPDFVAKLKKGQMLTIQAINLAGVQISFPLPLNDFAKANEGPPTDPKVYEEQQKKLQDELQKRAEEARKKLEQQQGAPAAPPK